MHTWNRIILTTALGLWLAGCNDTNNDYDFTASEAAAQQTFIAQQAAAPAKPPAGAALFNPGDGTIPSATNLLMLGSSDGTLNIPIDSADSDGVKTLKATLNALDGFSTTSPITTVFDTSLDTASIQPMTSIRVFEVTTNSVGATTGLVGELGAGDYTAVATGTNLTTLAIVPLKPLKPTTSYLVVLTNQLKTSSGNAMQADVAYNLCKSSTPLGGSYAALEPLRQLTSSFEMVASAAGVNPASIILSWVFSTQSTTEVMSTVANSAQAGTITATPSGVTTSQYGLAGKADISVGTLDVPYYLGSTTEHPLAPITSRWVTTTGGEVTRYMPLPALISTQTIPLLLTTPNASAAGGQCPQPASGWPVVIFQHGITRQKTDLLALADALADACHAGIAIDLPLHGERTFAVDYIDNNSGAPTPDGTADPSGQHFINLASLLTTRDNNRQAVSDLVVLHKSIGAISGLDGNNVSFIGHSLGGMVGTLFAAVDPNLVAASLAMPGGGIARLLDGSVEFGPVIRAGLAANGVTPGSADYDAFMVVAQSAIDSADPINFAALARSNTPIHLMEVVGGSGSPADTVMPNSVVGAPLSGTEPLIAAFGLPAVTSDTFTSTGASGAVRFTAGSHRSLLDPSYGLNVTVEMQIQAITFVASGGTLIDITDPSIIAP